MSATDNLALWRRLTAVTAVGLIAAACGAEVDTTASPSASPTASETSSTPTAPTGPLDLPTGAQIDLPALTYSLPEFPVEITFEIPPFEAPARWFSCSPGELELSVCYASTGDPEESIVALTFQIVENVVTDPCQDQETAELLDPPVGPSVDDLVGAISYLEGFEATAPVDISVSGFEGKEFTLTAPDAEGCGATWATADRTTGMGAGEINLIRILDVDGERIVITSAYGPETANEELAALESVMDSVEIEA